LTADEIRETDPTWSADGTILAFGHVDEAHPEDTFIEGLVGSFRVADDIRELLGEERHSSSDFVLVVSHHSPQE
jgi:hypothetical protein